MNYRQKVVGALAATVLVAGILAVSIPSPETPLPSVPTAEEKLHEHLYATARTDCFEVTHPDTFTDAERYQLATAYADTWAETVGPDLAPYRGSMWAGCMAGIARTP